jgi:hypothetical protein
LIVIISLLNEGLCLDDDDECGGGGGGGGGKLLVLFQSLNLNSFMNPASPPNL